MGKNTHNAYIKGTKNKTEHVGGAQSVNLIQFPFGPTT